MLPLLTICIPTYNGSKTIRNMLDLLLPQCSNEIEVIISDNCSIDETPSIIKEYLNAYPQIRYIRNNENIGPDANFLQCMQEARGKFTWLVSDDDVVIEGSVKKIVNFLRNSPEVSLVYLTTVDFRGEYIGIKSCTIHKPILPQNICTKDKKLFMKYAGEYWGFMSSFLCKTEAFNKIKKPENYYGTFWLQSYIHALCAAGDETALGLVKGPCVGAGIYVNTANFDSAKVNGLYYKKLLKFMIKNCGFDKNQLEDLFVWRICLLSRHDIIKEKASGQKKINIKLLFSLTKKYPQAWLTVYPFLLIPNFICKYALGTYKKMKGMKGSIKINRPE